MFFAILLLTTSAGAVKNHPVSHWNTQSIIQKQLSLKRMTKQCSNHFNKTKLKTIRHSQIFARACTSNSEISLEVPLSVISIEAKNEGKRKLSFVGIVQVYSGKTATTFNGNAIVAHSVHAVHLSFTPMYRRFLFDYQSYFCRATSCGHSDR